MNHIKFLWDAEIEQWLTHITQNVRVPTSNIIYELEDCADWIIYKILDCLKIIAEDKGRFNFFVDYCLLKSNNECHIMFSLEKSQLQQIADRFKLSQVKVDKQTIKVLEIFGIDSKRGYKITRDYIDIGNVNNLSEIVNELGKNLSSNLVFEIQSNRLVIREY